MRGEYQLVSRAWKRDPTPVRIGDREISEGKVFIIAGPCSVESRDQILSAAKAVKEMGAHALRGGAFKPRTSPYSFQGLGEGGPEAVGRGEGGHGAPRGDRGHGRPGHTRRGQSTRTRSKIGARNMQNFSTPEEARGAGRPVLLKRGFGNTVDEWLAAAEYVALHGNGDVALVERGIRTFDRTLRFTLDVGAIAYAKQATHLPVIGDPSHPAGDRRFVIPLALAILAAGADGLIVEVHPDPDKALSDAAQQLTFGQFGELMEKARALARALGKTLE
jgi:phospho-2-dehydro-3-deoxyheptonate aldolase